MHAFGKITLFFCAGAIMVRHHRKYVSQVVGLGWKDPWVFGAFAVGAASVTGLPPTGGSWSKLYLAWGALEAGQGVFVAVLMISSLLNVIYLFDIVGKAFFVPAPEDDHDDHHAPDPISRWTVVPPVLTAAGCLVLFGFGGWLVDLLGTVEGL